jgi:hypothetical protein
LETAVQVGSANGSELREIGSLRRGALALASSASSTPVYFTASLMVSLSSSLILPPSFSLSSSWLRYARRNEKQGENVENLLCLSEL